MVGPTSDLLWHLHSPGEGVGRRHVGEAEAGRAMPLAAMMGNFLCYQTVLLCCWALDVSED